MNYYYSSSTGLIKNSSHPTAAKTESAAICIYYKENNARILRNKEKNIKQLNHINTVLEENEVKLSELKLKYPEEFI